MELRLELEKGIYGYGSYGDQIIGFHEHLEQLTLPLVLWEGVRIWYCSIFCGGMRRIDLRAPRSVGHIHTGEPSARADRISSHQGLQNIVVIQVGRDGSAAHC